MKRTALLFSVALAIGSSSCEKAEKLLFQPFESPLNFNVSVAEVSNTEVETVLGETSVNFNLDQEVKDATEGRLDGDVVGAMYINEVAIDLQNADEANSLSNFDFVTLSVSSGSSTPVVFGPFEVPDGVTTSTVFAVQNSPNVKSFFSGQNVAFKLIGKANTATTKTLEAQVSATIKFDK